MITNLSLLEKVEVCKASYLWISLSLLYKQPPTPLKTNLALEQKKFSTTSLRFIKLLSSDLVPSG